MNAAMANLPGRLRGRRSITIALMLAVSIWTCGSALGAVPQDVSMFEHANQEFSQAHYAQAVKEYSAILAQRGFAAGVLVNRGNAWRKLNQPGHAILDYERAAWLRPSDGSIATTLQTIRQQAGVAVTKPDLLRRSVSALSFNTLGGIACGMSLALAAIVLIARSRRPKLTAKIRAAVVACAVIGIAAGAALIARWPELDRAVVLDAATPVRVAPAAAADVSFALPAGDVVQVAKRYQGYLRVRTADGRSGWADSRNVAQIVGSIPG